jgi:hypothetical protein
MAYQYKLRLRLPAEPPKIHRNLPHLIFHAGQWKLFRSKWKSQFVGPKLYAACTSGNTIPEIQQKVRRHGQA